MLTCRTAGQTCVVGAEEDSEKANCGLFGFGDEFGECEECLGSGVAGKAAVDDVETSDEHWGGNFLGQTTLNESDLFEKEKKDKGKTSLELTILESGHECEAAVLVTRLLGNTVPE